MTQGADRPNILLIVSDQHRGDALGAAGHPVVQTPYLDQIAGNGTRFTRAYSACPVCVPARRTLMTGARPANQGVVMNYDTDLDLPTLPGILSRAGYHTHLAGKLHLYPIRALYGFMSADWADSPAQWHLGRYRNDYQRHLIRHGHFGPDLGYAHGMDGNGWTARPWHMDERFHYSNWVAESALTFLERRDPTVPFFLKASFFAPHQPFTPPAYYFDKYMQMDIPEPSVGDWARVHDSPPRGPDVNAWHICLGRDQYRRMCAGYYGSIEHNDHQIGRLLRHVPPNTVIVYTSDHGEMLGDHQLARKRVGYEGSANIPLLVQLPGKQGRAQQREIDAPVELMDIMPTLLDLAGVACPETVDGQSLVPLIRNEPGTEWRTHIHGECAFVGSQESGTQFVTDGREKYIWYPGTGVERFFDLRSDPTELHDLSADPAHADRVSHWRGILIREIAERPEGFVRDGKLAVLGGATKYHLPGYMRPGDTGTMRKQLLDHDR